MHDHKATWILDKGQRCHILVNEYRIFIVVATYISCRIYAIVEGTLTDKFFEGSGIVE